MSKRSPIYGVGINDSDYVTQKSVYENGKRRVIWCCPFFDRWRKMIQRCYSQTSSANHKYYSGCSVADIWQKFSEFRLWIQCQDWEGNHIDKDLLVPGNKVYSPEFCVMIPQRLNNFLTDNGAKRGDTPIGVSFRASMGKYQANCGDPFSSKKVYLGLFDDPGSAYEAWRRRKHELACQYADEQTDERIAKALRERFATNKLSHEEAA